MSLKTHLYDANDTCVLCGIDEREGEAFDCTPDSRLFYYASDLLAALKDIVAANDRGGNTLADVRAMTDQARAVIAKAEGSEK